jgi:hypothetical protein
MSRTRVLESDLVGLLEIDRRDELQVLGQSHEAGAPDLRLNRSGT